MDTIYDKLTAIADSIREKTGKSGSLTLDDMAYEISTIKGSADLNFDIIAYETEEALLAATPAENTIGVITTTPITSWTFSGTEPDSIEEGMVWINVGTGSSVKFNALKNNAIQVCPRYVQQYIDGAWVVVLAMSYQNNEWIEISANLLSLYVWKAIGLKLGNTNTAAYAPTATKNSDGSVTLVMPGSGVQQRGGYVINELVDLTSANWLKVKYNNMTYKTYAEFQPSILPDGYDNQNDKIVYTLLNTDNSFPTSGEVVVDVSGLSGFYYIFLATYATNSGNLTITITEVTLE